MGMDCYITSSSCLGSSGFLTLVASCVEAEQSFGMSIPFLPDFLPNLIIPCHKIAPHFDTPPPQLPLREIYFCKI
jgi:hypothetical protein